MERCLTIVGIGLSFFSQKCYVKYLTKPIDLILLFNYLILISSRYQHRLSMPKINLIYKDDSPNEKLGKYSKASFSHIFCRLADISAVIRATGKDMLFLIYSGLGMHLPSYLL